MSNNPSQRVSSGEKYRNEHGTAAIKDGMKQRKAQAEAPSLERKPKWLRAQIPGGERFEAVKKNVAPFARSRTARTWASAGPTVPPPSC